jgi:predicted RNA binding protein YcfA (HicA-like mRNA interferase family)
MSASVYPIDMTASELMRILKRRGCVVKPGKGSHMKVVCGKCGTVVPMHRGDIPPGTLRSIVRLLEPCLGKDWHKE